MGFGSLHESVKSVPPKMGATFTRRVFLERIAALAGIGAVLSPIACAPQSTVERTVIEARGVVVRRVTIPGHVMVDGGVVLDPAKKLVRQPNEVRLPDTYNLTIRYDDAGTSRTFEHVTNDSQFNVDTNVVVHIEQSIRVTKLGDKGDKRTPEGTRRITNVVRVP